MASSCPISHTDYLQARPALEHYEHLDRERELAPLVTSNAMAWPIQMVTRYDDVRAAFNDPAFSCEVTNSLNVPRQIDIIPNMLDGEEHRAVRRLLNPFFSPAAVKRMAPLALERCIALIEELQPRGECDLVSGFALRYPTEIFLSQLGLPLADGEFFLPWVETVFSGLMGPEKEAAAVASNEIIAYFRSLVEERRRHLLDPVEDLVSRLLITEIDGERVSDEVILTTCMTLMLAGLDTTRSALGFTFHHLAVHPEDRRSIVEDPASIPSAVEEMLRLYPLVIQAGRLATTDTTAAGQRILSGDVMWLGIGSANRDPRKFEEPQAYDPTRPGLNQHLAFGAGPHRCLGMHLARLELATVLREWHRRIPEYRLRPDAEVVSRGGQLSLLSLPLEWPA